MILLYFIILLYLAPKVAIVYQQKDSELFFTSRIDAYECALKDIRAEQVRKREEQAAKEA